MRCKVCKESFKPIRFLQKDCGKLECKQNLKRLKVKDKKPKVKSGRKTKNVDKSLDNAWSLVVKLIAGEKCEVCGKTNALNSHHVYSRSKRSTRWHIPNGICLCAGCHVFSSTFSAHKTPTEFTEWIKEYRGEQWYNNLREKANETWKGTTEEKYRMLDEINKLICSF